MGKQLKGLTAIKNTTSGFYMQISYSNMFSGFPLQWIQSADFLHAIYLLTSGLLISCGHIEMY